ncbi:MAG: linear amide C-N hydrolase [Turicibacter sp.]|nr:linear amide C-N hydrolase [Turicibacter sp.]
MCTALTLKTTKDEYFLARNFDYLSSSYLQAILAPRNFSFMNQLTDEKLLMKYAVLGMTLLHEGELVFVDGINEKGLTCAILDLPGEAAWNHEIDLGKDNLLPTDVSFYILSTFSNISEVKEGITRLNIVAPKTHPFAKETQIHWIVADNSGACVVIEQTRESFNVYDNEVGVLTNAPTFDQQLLNLKRVNNHEVPGDYSSPSRFIRTAFLKNHLELADSIESTIQASFHLLKSVAMLRGVMKQTINEDYETRYTACMCMKTKKYYYCTYDNLEIYTIDLNKEDLNQSELIVYPYPNQQFRIQNQN